MRDLIDRAAAARRHLARLDTELAGYRLRGERAPLGLCTSHGEAFARVRVAERAVLRATEGQR